MTSLAPGNDVDEATPVASNIVLPPYKSYKKKFLKLRHQFRDQMRASNQLYEDEQHALRIASRLQEQNDQLLELLLDINDFPRLPPHLRYDLRSPPPRESEVPELEPDDTSVSREEVLQAHSALQEMRAELDARQLSRSEFQRNEAGLLEIIGKPRSLATLNKTSHTTPDSVRPDHLPDVHEEHPVGYLNPAHEEEFLANLDNYLESDPPSEQPLPPRLKPGERERERDAQQKNPMSVYNWLAAHRPKEMMDDEPPMTVTEKPAKAPRKPSPNPKATTSGGTPRTGSKRERGGQQGAKLEDQEMLDDDGNLLGATGEDAVVMNKKRKRGQADDDVAYRPKGGSSKKRRRTGTRNSNAGLSAAAAGDAPATPGLDGAEMS